MALDSKQTVDFLNFMARNSLVIDALHSAGSDILENDNDAIWTRFRSLSLRQRLRAVDLELPSFKSAFESLGRQENALQESVLFHQNSAGAFLCLDEHLQEAISGMSRSKHSALNHRFFPDKKWANWSEKEDGVDSFWILSNIYLIDYHRAAIASRTGANSTSILVPSSELVSNIDRLKQAINRICQTQCRQLIVQRGSQQEVANASRQANPANSTEYLTRLCLCSLACFVCRRIYYCICNASALSTEIPGIYQLLHISNDNDDDDDVDGDDNRPLELNSGFLYAEYKRKSIDNRKLLLRSILTSAGPFSVKFVILLFVWRLLGWRPSEPRIIDIACTCIAYCVAELSNSSFKSSKRDRVVGRMLIDAIEQSLPNRQTVSSCSVVLENVNQLMDWVVCQVVDPIESPSSSSLNMIGGFLFEFSTLLPCCLIGAWCREINSKSTCLIEDIWFEFNRERSESIDDQHQHHINNSDDGNEVKARDDDDDNDDDASVPPSSSSSSNKQHKKNKKNNQVTLNIKTDTITTTIDQTADDPIKTTTIEPDESIQSRSISGIGKKKKLSTRDKRKLKKNENEKLFLLERQNIKEVVKLKSAILVPIEQVIAAAGLAVPLLVTASDVVAVGQLDVDDDDPVDDQESNVGLSKDAQLMTVVDDDDVRMDSKHASFDLADVTSSSSDGLSNVLTEASLMTANELALKLPSSSGHVQQPLILMLPRPFFKRTESSSSMGSDSSETSNCSAISLIPVKTPVNRALPTPVFDIGKPLEGTFSLLESKIDVAVVNCEQVSDDADGDGSSRSSLRVDGESIGRSSQRGFRSSIIDNLSSLLLSNRVSPLSISASHNEPERKVEDLISWGKYIVLLELLTRDVLDMADMLRHIAEVRRPWQIGVIEKLKEVVRGIWGGRVTVEVFGSFMTGLSVPASDIDVVVCGMELSWNNHKNQVAALTLLADQLKNSVWVSTVNTIPKTAVPVIKLTTAPVPTTFGDSRGIIRMDISCCAHPTISSSSSFTQPTSATFAMMGTSHFDPESTGHGSNQLLNQASAVVNVNNPFMAAVGSDVPSQSSSSSSRSSTSASISIANQSPQPTISLSSAHKGFSTSAFVQRLTMNYPVTLQALVLVLKQFLLEKGLHDAYTGGLSSYGLTIMVASILQKHTLERPEHQPCLGELLLAFLVQFGACFDSRKFAVCMSPSGPLIPLTPLLASSRLYKTTPDGVNLDPVVIQDPLVHNNNIGSTCFAFRHVQVQFVQALDTLWSYIEVEGEEIVLSANYGVQYDPRRSLKSMLGQLFGAGHHRNVVRLAAQVWCPQEVQAVIPHPFAPFASLPLFPMQIPQATPIDMGQTVLMQQQTPSLPSFLTVPVQLKKRDLIPRQQMLQESADVMATFSDEQLARMHEWFMEIRKHPV